MKKILLILVMVFASHSLLALPVLTVVSIKGQNRIFSKDMKTIHKMQLGDHVTDGERIEIAENGEVVFQHHINVYLVVRGDTRFTIERHVGLTLKNFKGSMGVWSNDPFGKYHEVLVKNEKGQAKVKVRYNKKIKETRVFFTDRGKKLLVNNCSGLVDFLPKDKASWQSKVLKSGESIEIRRVFDGTYVANSGRIFKPDIVRDCSALDKLTKAKASYYVFDEKVESSASERAKIRALGNKSGAKGRKAFKAKIRKKMISIKKLSDSELKNEMTSLAKKVREAKGNIQAKQLRMEMKLYQRELRKRK